MDPRADNDEAPRDPGAGQPLHSYTDKDFEGHRAHSLFVGVRPPPQGYQRPHHRSRRRHHRHQKPDDKPEDPVYERGRRASLIVDPGFPGPLTPPSQRVQFILGEEDAMGSSLEPHPLFSEMETLCAVDGGEKEWKETARWVKFEEDVEEGGNRWSKPHVGTLSLHSLFELRSLILNGCVMLDMEASSLEHIADLLLDNLISSGALPDTKRQQCHVQGVAEVSDAASNHLQAPEELFPDHLRPLYEEDVGDAGNAASHVKTQTSALQTDDDGSLDRDVSALKDSVTKELDVNAFKDHILTRRHVGSVARLGNYHFSGKPRGGEHMKARRKEWADLQAALRRDGADYDEIPQDEEDDLGDEGMLKEFSARRNILDKRYLGALARTNMFPQGYRSSWSPWLSEMARYRRYRAESPAWRQKW